jgi:hypothetical protein
MKRLYYGYVTRVSYTDTGAAKVYIQSHLVFAESLPEAVGIVTMGSLDDTEVASAKRVADVRMVEVGDGVIREACAILDAASPSPSPAAAKGGAM